MYRTIKSLIKHLLNRYPARVLRQEFERQEFTRFNERPVEFAFIFKNLAKIYPREILDVGSGTTALASVLRNCGFLVTATDNVRDYWPSGMLNRHYYVIDDDITNTHLNKKYDLITCISVLEHIEKADSAVRNMFALLNPNGYLILTFPYSAKGYVRNVYELPGSSYGQGAPYITQSYSSRLRKN
jgi:2-polyprenyl-3-methyl-5-hydroxy-6-metoxy-1,4-benzoquinol methylase